MQVALGLNAFITAQGFSRTSMLTVLIGAVLNIILDPVFIFALNMGVRGAALATILSQAVSALWVVRFLTGKKTHLRIRVPYLRISAKVYLPCVALGLSPFIMQFTESVLYVCFNSSLLRYGGNLAVGAMTILSSVMQFSLLPLQGLTQGAQPIVSFNYGAGNKDRVRACFRMLIVACTVYSAALWALAMLTPQLFAAIFTSDPALRDMTVHALRIYMAATGLFGIQVGCQQTFVAMGNAKTSVFLALLRKVFLLIPLIFILPCFLPNKVDAVFLAEPISDFIAVCVTGTMFYRSFSRYLKERPQSACRGRLHNRPPRVREALQAPGGIGRAGGGKRPDRQAAGRVQIAQVEGIGPLPVAKDALHSAARRAARARRWARHGGCWRRCCPRCRRRPARPTGPGRDGARRRGAPAYPAERAGHRAAPARARNGFADGRNKTLSAVNAPRETTPAPARGNARPTRGERDGRHA